MVIPGSVFHQSTRLSKHGTKIVYLSKPAIETLKSSSGFKVFELLHSLPATTTIFYHAILKFILQNRPSISVHDSHVFSQSAPPRNTSSPLPSSSRTARARPRTGTDLISISTLPRSTDPHLTTHLTIPIPCLYVRESGISASTCLYLARDKTARATRSPRVHNTLHIVNKFARLLPTYLRNRLTDRW